LKGVGSAFWGLENRVSGVWGHSPTQNLPF